MMIKIQVLFFYTCCLVHTLRLDILFSIAEILLRLIKSIKQRKFKFTCKSLVVRGRQQERHSNSAIQEAKAQAENIKVDRNPEVDTSRASIARKMDTTYLSAGS